MCTPCRARTGVPERLLAFDSLCGATARITERLLAFDSLCGATARVTERLLAYQYTGVFEHMLDYYSRFRISTTSRLLLSLAELERG